MKRHVSKLTALLCFAAQIALGATYTNPVYSGGIADPCVIFHNGTFYMYPTGDNTNYDVYTSPDLVTWTKGARVFSGSSVSRTATDVWAPEVIRNPDNGMYYMYWTVGNLPGRAVGVSSSSSPTGTFGNPVSFTNGIDAHLFRDDDAKLYLYYSKWWVNNGVTRWGITYMALKSYTERADGADSVQLTWPELPWEGGGGHYCNEGPQVIKRNGLYYLMFSAGLYSSTGYAVGYATSTSPTGPFVKYAGNPIMRSGPNGTNGTLLGPGHGTAIQLPSGEWWYVYHQLRTQTSGYDRVICIDPMWWDAEGVLHIDGSRGVARTAPNLTPTPVHEIASKAPRHAAARTLSPVYSVKSHGSIAPGVTISTPQGACMLLNGKAAPGSMPGSAGR